MKKINSESIILDKNIFKNDLLWSIKNGSVIKIDNLITVYCSRANQIDTDTLCRLYGVIKVEKVIEKYISDSRDRREAMEQVKYFINEKTYYYLIYQNERNLLLAPTQRGIDTILKYKGELYLSEIIQSNGIGFRGKMELSEMKEYFKFKNT